MPFLSVGDMHYQYNAEANAGVMLTTGERWWRTLIRWRPGITGHWRRSHLIDVHPFDTAKVERALRSRLERLPR